MGQTQAKIRKAKDLLCQKRRTGDDIELGAAAGTAAEKETPSGGIYQDRLSHE